MKTAFHGGPGDERTRRGSDEPPSDLQLQTLTVPIDGCELRGEIALPPQMRGMVLLANATSQGKLRSDLIGDVLNAAGLGVAMFRLLTADEEARDSESLYWRFDIELLTQRLVAATAAVRRQPPCQPAGFGFLAAGGATAAAIIAAVELGAVVQAIVSRDGRPDLAGPALPRLNIPTLLIVREQEEHLVQLNRRAAGKMTCAPRVSLLPPGGDLFAEAQEIGLLAADWFLHHLAPAGGT